MIVARYHKFVKGKLTVSCLPCYNAIAIKPHPQVQTGRIYNPPLQTRLRLSRRGRCPHRPASPLRARQSADRFGRRAACPHAALAELRGPAAWFGGVWAPRPTIQNPAPWETAVRRGRPYRPPLRTRPRGCRRGGLYARPDRVPIPTGVRWFHRRRGALYMRPCRTAGITGPASEIAGLPGRIYNPPLRVRSAMVHPTRRCGRPYGPAPGGVVKTILEV